MAGGLRWRAGAARARVRAGRRLRAVARAHREGRLARPHLLPAPTGRASCATRPTACTTSATACTPACGRSGRVLERHLVLTPDGAVLAIAPPPPGREPAPRAAGAAVAAGLVAVVIASSAPPLAAAIRDAAAGLTLAWAPLAGDLAVLDAGRASLSRRACGARSPSACTAAGEPRRAGAARLRRARRAGRWRSAMRCGRARRRGWPRRRRPPRRRALATGRSPAEAAAGAREIGRAVEALLEDAGQLLA